MAPPPGAGAGNVPESCEPSTHRRVVVASMASMKRVRADGWVTADRGEDAEAELRLTSRAGGGHQDSCHMPSAFLAGR